jgi:class 3 adenylate cyclase
MGEVAEWLDSLGLGGYAHIFADNDIDLGVLPHLTDQDLKDLGLSLGHRRKLLAAISTLRKTNETLDSPAGPAGVKAPDHADAERRQLTVMFCGLVGSTELSQRLDPEDLREVLRRYQDAVSGAVIRYEGYVAKFLGDGVLAYFGWPQAHEDQAERAVHAALDAVAAVQGVTADGGQALQSRVGIATGQVVIGDIVGDAAAEVGAVVGETPNLAARLQALADPGTVIVGDATRRLIGHAFELEDKGPQRLKGFANSIRAWRVVGKSAVESRFEAAHGAALTQLVGREQEIALLLDRWMQAKDGEGQVVLLSGEAGIGKSRILRELWERIGDDPHDSLRYQCSPYQVNAAFNPIRQAGGLAGGDARR